MPLAIDQQRQDDPQEAAMEGHSALPHFDDVERIVREMERIVEDHKAEPSAQNDAKREPNEEIVDLLRSDRRAAVRPKGLVADEALRVPDGEDDAGYIGERIPAHREGTDPEGDGIDIGEVDHGG